MSDHKQMHKNLKNMITKLTIKQTDFSDPLTFPLMTES